MHTAGHSSTSDDLPRQVTVMHVGVVGKLSATDT